MRKRKVSFMQSEIAEIFKAYNQEELENFKCIFDMFDKDKTGYVNVEELQTIIQSLGRDPSEA